MSVVAAGAPWAIALAPPDVGFPAEILDALGWAFQAPLPVPPAVGGLSVGLGVFHEGATGMGLTGCGDGAWTASFPTGICGRRQAEIAYQVP